MDVPSPWIAGGNSANEIASFICEQRSVGAARDGRGRVLLVAFAPVLERDEGEAGVLARAREAEAATATILSTAGSPLKMSSTFSMTAARAVAARARRHLDVDDEEALVLVRQEGCRQAA